MHLLSELTGRALLKNLRLLPGLRPEAGARRLRLAVAGPQCAAIAARLRLLEPTLDVEALATETGGLDLAPLSGANLDSLLLVQPYHSLRRLGELAGAQGALHTEEGTLGLLWARAMPQEGWGADYTRGAASAAAAGVGSSTLPLLAGSDASPMQWVDDLGLTNYGFEQPKHRKFIEVLEGAWMVERAGGRLRRACQEGSAGFSHIPTPTPTPYPDLSRLAGPPQQYFEDMPLLHDARLPLGAASPAQRAGEAAAAAAPPGRSLTVHQHAFHCVQSAGVRAAQRAKQATAAGAAAAAAGGAAAPR